MIYARVVAKPVNYPEKLDIRYETVDRQTGEEVAVFGAQRRFSWEEIKLKFPVSEERALECEAQLRQGENALIAHAQEWESGSNPTKTAFAAFSRSQVKTVTFESWARDLVESAEAIADQESQSQMWLANNGDSWEGLAELLMVLRELDLFVKVFRDKLSQEQFGAANDLAQAALAFDFAPDGQQDPNEVLRDPAWQSLRSKARKVVAEFQNATT